MQNQAVAAQAYQSQGQKGAAPRELEAMLLMKAAAKLQAVVDSWPDSRGEKMDHALTYNRKLWTMFVANMADPECGHPKQLRENISNLGLYSFKQMLSVSRSERPENLRGLVSINRNLAAGLRGE